MEGGEGVVFGEQDIDTEDESKPDEDYDGDHPELNDHASPPPKTSNYPSSDEGPSNKEYPRNSFTNIDDHDATGYESKDSSDDNNAEINVVVNPNHPCLEASNLVTNHENEYMRRGRRPNTHCQSHDKNVGENFSRNIQSPVFCTGKGQILNKNKSSLPTPMLRISNRQRMQRAQDEAQENIILKKHVSDMKILVHKIEQMQSSEEFDVLNDKHVGTLKAIQDQFCEMNKQFHMFNKIKERISTSQGEESNKQLQRELFKLKGRLPALAKRNDIESHVDNFPESGRFLVIQGQTGSGKSTQIPQYLADHPKFVGKRIVCTQPRKIAAVSLAQRVSFEYSGGLWAQPGKDVGYQIGGKKIRGKRIEFVTEGIMLERIMSGSDKPFKDVGCIVIDEAHERSVICDILLGSFKKPDARWKDCLIMITSATIDLQEFSSFFDYAPTVEIEGRMFPIEKFYHPLPDVATSEISLIRKEVVNKALEIHISCGPTTGDILCFLPGQDDVLNAKDDFERELIKFRADAQLLPKVYAIFGRQDPEQQQAVFEKLQKNTRKIIFATDVAETSVTIDGVVYVVDSGVRKEMIFDPKRNISTLKLATISKSSATQRAGRSGRTESGECHRLYSESDYLSMSPSSAPEVFRKPLSLAILSLIEMNITPREFEWISAPSKDAVSAAEEELRYLGAITECNKTTDLGKLISKCQQEPKLVRMIFRGCQDGFGEAAVTIASIFTVANMFFYIGVDDTARQESKRARSSFALEGGDVVTMFRVFQEYLKVVNGIEDKGNIVENRKQNQDEVCTEDADQQVGAMEVKKKENGRKLGREWCRKNYINGKAVGLIISTKNELRQLFKTTSVWKEQLNQSREPTDADLRRLVFSGYFLHAARLVHSRHSRLPQYFAIHPSVTGTLDFKSAVVHHTANKTEPGNAPEWMVYEKILRLKTTLFPTSTPIDFSWIEEESPEFFSHCLKKQDDLPTEKVIIQTSQECLRKIFGRYFIHLNSLEEELSCNLDVDIENGILVGYCPIAMKSRVEADLKRKVAEVMKVLTDQVEEEDYLGGTRVVVGQGYEVKEVLFPQEFITLFIRNLHPSVSKTELSSHMELLGLSIDIRSVDMFPYQTCKTAVIKLYSKSAARVALGILKTEPFRGKELDISRGGMGPRKGVTQEEVYVLKLSWALGESEGKAQVCFHTSQEANNFIEQVSSRFGGARVTVVHGEVTTIAGKQSKRQGNRNKNAKPQPPAIIIRGLPDGACRFRFLENPDGGHVESNFDYKLTVVDLPRDIDEQEIFRRMKPIVPKWAKVTRKLHPETLSAYENGISDAELKEKLAPLQEYIPNSAYTRFYLDKNLSRAIIYVSIDDKLALQRASKIDYCPGKNGNKFGQPYRLEIEYNHTTSVHADLYSFIKDDIAQIKNLAYRKGAQVWDSAERKPNKNGTKPIKSKFIFIKFRCCNPHLIRELHENLETVSSCTKFNHDNLHLLFTHTGKIQLDHIAKSTFLYWNARNYGLYIYGSLDVQEKTKKELQSVIDLFSSMEVLDRPLMISKKKVNLKGGKVTDLAKIDRICASSGIDFYDFMGNRILASGSEKAFSKLKHSLEKDGFLFEKRTSQLSKLKGRPECTICFMPPDGDFVQSSMCPHAFCIDCMQHMFQIMPPNYPAKCPGEDCGALLGIGEIVKMAKKDSLKKFLEVAVVKYQQQHPTEVFLCPKQECGQLLCANSKIVGEYGGEFYFCDECVTTYCIPCSMKAEKPCKSHEFDTCEDARNGVSNVVHQHVKAIQENIFNLRCPKCSTTFFDFNGCAAVICETCNCGFCGICLMDCGSDADAHAHVRQCPKNPKKNEYYISEPALIKIHREMRTQKLKIYLQDVQKQVEPQIMESILRAIRRDLIDLKISENDIK